MILLWRKVRKERRKKRRKKKKAKHPAGFKPTSSRIYAPEASALPLRYNHGPICKLFIHLGFWDPRLEFLCPFVLLPEVWSRRGWTGRGWSRLSAGPRSDRGGWAGRGRRPNVGWRSPTRTRSAATGWTRCWNRFTKQDRLSLTRKKPFPRKTPVKLSNVIHHVFLPAYLSTTTNQDPNWDFHDRIGNGRKNASNTRPRWMGNWQTMWQRPKVK